MHLIELSGRATALGAALVASFCAAAGALSLGCSSLPNRTAAAELREKRPCDASVDVSGLAPVLDGSAIERARPLYAPVAGRESDAQTRALAGAMIDVRPLPGMTAQWLHEGLQCHSDRAAAGGETASDPFSLPGKRVDIRVQPARDSFLVAVVGLDTDDARAIAARAADFASRPRP